MLFTMWVIPSTSRGLEMLAAAFSMLHLYDKRYEAQFMQKWRHSIILLILFFLAYAAASLGQVALGN